MLNEECRDFCQSWLRKADAIAGVHIAQAVDRFIALFIVYNRLYAEVTRILESTGGINLSKRTFFPDSDAATDYVVQYLGCKNLLSVLESNQDCAAALGSLVALLSGPVSGYQFHIKLDKIDGSWQREVDLELLKRLQSNNSNERATAVLDFIYSVRCNLLHGHKGFEPVQIEVLGPATVMLRRVIDTLYPRLDT